MTDADHYAILPSIQVASMPASEHANTPTSTHVPVSADPVRAALVAALSDMRQRFHRALILGGTDPEFADAACVKADEALALARGQSPGAQAP